MSHHIIYTRTLTSVQHEFGDLFDSSFLLPFANYRFVSRCVGFSVALIHCEVKYIRVYSNGYKVTAVVMGPTTVCRMNFRRQVETQG